MHIFFQDICFVAVIKYLTRKHFPHNKSAMLGHYLGVEPGQISTIKSDCQNDSGEIFNKVIDFWLKNDEEKSWGKLAEALEYCGYTLIARDMRRDKGVTESFKEGKLKYISTNWLMFCISEIPVDRN